MPWLRKFLLEVNCLVKYNHVPSLFSDINVTPNTLFAPTDDAFRKLPNDTMDIIRKNQQYCERKHINEDISLIGCK